MTKSPTYLDYAAATPLDRQVLAVMSGYLKRDFYNPSATYLAARHSRQVLEAARAAIAQILGARPSEIIFTAGATEANNLAIAGVMNQYPGGEVLLSAIEHKSVVAPTRAFRHRLIPVNHHGLVEPANLSRLINNQTVLVSVGLVNNELGTVQPLREVAAVIKQARQSRPTKPLFLHTDAAQAPNFFDLKVSRLGVDLLTLNAGKVYGPKQAGLLYKTANLNLRPLIVGGGQEGGWRAGTENVAAALGLAKALAIAETRRPNEVERLQKLRQQFIAGLRQAMPSVIVNGGLKYAAPHIISATFPGHDNERLMMELDECGIQVAVGSACSAADVEPSAVLRAIGLSDALARATLRISLGRGTTAAQLNRLVKILQQLVTTR